MYKQVVEVHERVKLLSPFEQASPDATPIDLQEYKRTLDQRVQDVIAHLDDLGPEQHSPVDINGPLVRMGEVSWIRVLQPPDLKRLARDLLRLKREGVSSLGICLMHSYLFDLHELAVLRVAQKIGFDNISCSSRIFPKANFVRRGNATLLDAYLNPIISDYLRRFLSGFTDASAVGSLTRSQNDEVRRRPLPLPGVLRLHGHFVRPGWRNRRLLRNLVSHSLGLQGLRQRPR